MSVVLGTPGGPEGQFANDHWEAGNQLARRNVGPLGRASRRAHAQLRLGGGLVVDHRGKLLNAVLPLSGSGTALRAEVPVAVLRRMRS